MPKLRQRVMRSRWGSCMPAKAIITMNTYLAIMPAEIIDHVMLHELCHLVHPNHSRHFYNVMTMIMPDWKERRAAYDAIPAVLRVTACLSISHEESIRTDGESLWRAFIAKDGTTM